MYIHEENAIHSISHGDGAPLVFIHGLAASLHDWESFIPRLASDGYCACALDLPGHGDSTKPDEIDAYHVDSLYETIRNWLEEQDLERQPVLVGHSLGGYLSLAYALRHPESVRGLVLIDPLYSPRQLSPLLRLLRRRPALGVRAMGLAPEWAIHTALRLDQTSYANFSSEARRQIVADYKRASPNILYITRSLPDLTPDLPKITPPTLVLWGERDLTLRPASFPNLIAALPHAQGNSLPDCGHQPHIGQPALVEGLISDFLATLQ